MTRIWSSSQSRFSTTFLVLTLFLSTVIPTAHASRGGVEDPNNKFTVGFTFNDGPTASVCSGILIAPTIIVTAKHCVRNDNGVDGTNYLFTNPGAAIDGAPSPAKVSRVAIGDADIAFIVLDSPLSGASYMRIADAATVAALPYLSPLFGHGYGAVFETSAPYSALVRRYPLDWRTTGKDANYVNTYELVSSEATACRGDSGGPITATVTNGEQVLLAVLSGAANVQNACGTQGLDGLYRMRVTLVHPYLNLVPEYTGVPVSQPSPKPSKKIVKITCIKGKVTKVISGTNPKCPKGYVLKKK
ncbi:MAG: trypsin-like serine protease [Actinomycetota bacterium]